MSLALERARKRIPIGGLVRCARSFYELIGNRRKAVRQPTSGNIFAALRGIAADTTYACSFVDISPKGMCVACHEPMAVDAIVQLYSDQEGPRRLAAVLYCLQRDDSYRIGLKFISEMEMNARRNSAARTQAGQRVAGKTV